MLGVDDFMEIAGGEFFYSVPDLKVPKYLDSDEFTGLIDKFIESVPHYTEALERFVTRDLDIESFIDKMERLYTLLCSIHANQLMVEADRILKLKGVSNGEFCRKLLTPFITKVRTLSIDIQMARNKSGNTTYRNRQELEACNDVVSSMSIISTLLNRADFKKASDIARSVNELQDCPYIMPLIAFITSQNQVGASGLVDEITRIYKARADEIINSKNENAVPKKLLMVDDMPEILTVVSYMLKDHYQVVSFSSGKEALNAIDLKHTPDAFLLDIDMPRLDGFELADIIRKKNKYRNTPILFLTAYGTINNLVKSTKFMNTTFIVKPVNKDILLTRLSGLLDTSD